jgi:hypothetical protein
MCSSRYKEKCLRDVAFQRAEELLGTERAKELGIDRVDIPKSDRSVCWVDTVGAHLKPCSQSEEYGSARRVAVEEIRRQQVRGGESVWNPVPIDLTATSGKCAAYSIVGSQKIPECVYRGLDIRWRGTGCFEHLRIG